MWTCAKNNGTATTCNHIWNKIRTYAISCESRLVAARFPTRMGLHIRPYVCSNTRKHWGDVTWLKKIELLSFVSLTLPPVRTPAVFTLTYSTELPSILSIFGASYLPRCHLQKKLKMVSTEGGCCSGQRSTPQSPQFERTFWRKFRSINWRSTFPPTSVSTAKFSSTSCASEITSYFSRRGTTSTRECPHSERGRYSMPCSRRRFKELRPRLSRSPSSQTRICLNGFLLFRNSSGFTFISYAPMPTPLIRKRYSTGLFSRAPRAKMSFMSPLPVLMG